MLQECLSKLDLVPSDLDFSVYDSLLDFPEPIQDEIVESFCRADLVSIRNKTGYFIGILKQYRKTKRDIHSAGAFPSLPASFAHSFPPSPSQLIYFPSFSSVLPPPYNPYSFPVMPQVSVSSFTPGARGFYGLPTAIQSRFREMFARGFAKEEDFPSFIYDSLQELEEVTQATILHHFCSTKITKIRNKAGYFLSLVKMMGETRFSPTNETEHYPFFPCGEMCNCVYCQQYPTYLMQPFPRGFLKLSQKAQGCVQSLISCGIIYGVNEIEDCVYDSLSEFSEKDQVKLCNHFAQANLQNVRNKTAFFIGILKRHRLYLQRKNASSSSNDNNNRPITTNDDNKYVSSEPHQQ